MRRSDPLTLTITVLSTVAVTSGLAIGLSERYVTSYAFCVEYRFISYDAVRLHRIRYLLSTFVRLGYRSVTYYLMIVCITAYRTYYRSDLVVLYIGIGLAHALGLV